MTKSKKRHLFNVNDGPYGNERPDNALRVAMNLVKREEVQVKIFLMGDGVQCAIKGQETPKDFYNIERMLKFIVGRGEVAT